MNIKKQFFPILIFFVIGFTSSCQTKFDKKVWEENNNFLKKDNPRLSMIDDIIKNHLKIGMEKEKVIELLGKPYSDTIGAKLPKGLKLPDSLKMNKILEKPKSKREYYMGLSNEWYKENYRAVPMVTYSIGWSLADPIFLEIEFNDKNEIVDFRTKEN